jgi:hypothetical protein
MTGRERIRKNPRHQFQVVAGFRWLFRQCGNPEACAWQCLGALVGACHGFKKQYVDYDTAEDIANDSIV